MSLPLKRSLIVSFSLLVFMLINSCSLFVPDPDTSEKSSSYKLTFQKKHWVEIDPDKSDHAFLHKKTNSILILNSTCKKYEASPLNHLVSSMLSGFEDIQYERKQSIQIFGRKGEKYKIKASLDGIMTYFLFVSVRKNRCLYDFALISENPARRIELTNDFNEFIASTKID